MPPPPAFPALTGSLTTSGSDYNRSARHFPHGRKPAIHGRKPAIHVRDARLTLLEGLIPGLFTAKDCLDVGCNAGTVSCQLAFDFGASSVTGVDLDPTPVRHAEALLNIRRSRLRPATDDSEQEVDYFLMASVMKHLYPRPQGKPFRRRGTWVPAPSPSQWPRVSFESGDWVSSTNPATSGPYHVILALSVIKWIHLEHLDEGLVPFFSKCVSSLVAGGYLIIELPWKSDQRAIRPKSPHFEQDFGKLHIRPETFDELLRVQGLILHTSSDVLPRRISVYRKI